MGPLPKVGSNTVRFSLSRPEGIALECSAFVPYAIFGHYYGPAEDQPNQARRDEENRCQGDQHHTADCNIKCPLQRPTQRAPFGSIADNIRKGRRPHRIPCPHEPAPSTATLNADVFDKPRFLPFAHSS